MADINEYGLFMSQFLRVTQQFLPNSCLTLPAGLCDHLSSASEVSDEVGNFITVTIFLRISAVCHLKHLPQF